MFGPMSSPPPPRKPPADPPSIPPQPGGGTPPNETLYINNLNDKINPKELKKHLSSIFKQFGEIRQIIAMKSFWRRGQAWIVFRDVETATRALNGLQGFPFFEKPLRVQYALKKSDLIAKEKGTFVERVKDGPKKPRAIQEREAKQEQIFAEMQKEFLQHMKQHMQGPAAQGKQFLIASAQAKAADVLREAAKRKGIDALPPLPPMPPRPPGFSECVTNRTLFVEEIPEDASEEDVKKAFEIFGGFQELRFISSRSIAFVDFVSQPQATVAMHSMLNREFRGAKLRITYAK